MTDSVSYILHITKCNLFALCKVYEGRAYLWSRYAGEILLILWWMIKTFCFWHQSFPIQSVHRYNSSLMFCSVPRGLIFEIAKIHIHRRQRNGDINSRHWDRCLYLLQNNTWFIHHSMRWCDTCGVRYLKPTINSLYPSVDIQETPRTEINFQYSETSFIQTACPD